MLTLLNGFWLKEKNDVSNLKDYSLVIIVLDIENLTLKPEEYYLFFEDWKLDPNQWSIFLDSFAVLLTIIGFLIAFGMYGKQRRDKAEDAFDFFQASLPELKESINKIIADLKEFHRDLDLDNSLNPVVSAGLNDNFLSKINLVDLNRYYRKYRKDKLPVFKTFLVDSNFFSEYQSYISNEINYFRTAYQEEEKTFSKWQLLRSKRFFSNNKGQSENVAYQDFYDGWVDDFIKDDKIFEMDQEGRSLKLKDPQHLVKHKIAALAREILPFIEQSEKANMVNMIANDVTKSYSEMSKMKSKFKRVIEKDTERFKGIVSNLTHLVEKK